ncbi:MAG: sigma-70 family RNA polymerase sigma factor [Candidatus Competibacteraceae bacterium]|nr:sigma-70 family RNA polymerase sigma factor [Candidatus Competibacteraceae bacterium]
MSHPEVLETLLAACVRRDRSAFEQLYLLVSPKLYSLCFCLLRREDLADEVLQEAFLQIWRDVGNFNPNRGSPMAWMTAVARHKALDLLRRRQPETALPANLESSDEWSDDGPGPLELISRLSDGQQLKRCLEELSPDQRQSVVMAFVHGLTHQQLSKRLGAPLGTVKSWVRRGLEKLKGCLQHETA